MKALFTISGAESYKPTAESFLQSLKAEFSEVGSKAKTLENNAYKYFSDYIMDLGVTEGKSFAYACAYVMSTWWLPFISSKLFSILQRIFLSFILWTVV